MTLLTCAALAGAISAASAGATLTLAPGAECPALTIANRDWSSRPVTLVLDRATVAGLSLRNVRGLNVRGGTIRAPGGMVAGPDGYAVRLQGASGIGIRGAHLTEAMRGLVMADSRDVVLAGNRLSGLRSDGINIVRSSHVLVQDNGFSDFRPNPSQCTVAEQAPVLRISRTDCTARGGKWRDGDHADGVQIWDRVSDVRIVGNRLEGDMQGIGLFGPPGEGGHHRIVAENNRVRVSSPHGITFGNCSDCAVVGNDVRPDGSGRHNAIIRTGNATGRFCGNVAPAMSRQSPAVQPCPR